MIPFAMLLLGLFSQPSQVSQVQISSSVHQGQTLRISFKLDRSFKRQNISAKIFDTEVPCYPAGDEDPREGYCMVGISARSRTGQYEIALYERKKSLFTHEINILETRFPVETLNLSNEKKSLLYRKERHKEVKIIRKTLKTESKKKSWDPDFIRPVLGRLSSVFGIKRKIDGKIRKSYHRGIDIAAKRGTPIRSMNNGKVILAGHYTEEGNMVMVDHGHGLISAYLHLSKFSVKKGDRINKGDEIGLVGDTGVSTKPHLHFGFYIHSVPVDPIPWIE